tara:strand:+ start:686 stop:928 length:243 start_codon:yes stop_codon:yes gene_type:complete
MTTILTVLNHDDETTETLTLAQFIKRFNNEQMSDALFSILSISYPILNDKAIASQTFTASDTIETRNGEKTFDPETATWR